MFLIIASDKNAQRKEIRGHKQFITVRVQSGRHGMEKEVGLSRQLTRSWEKRVSEGEQARKFPSKDTILFLLSTCGLP